MDEVCVSVKYFDLGLGTFQRPRRYASFVFEYWRILCLRVFYAPASTYSCHTKYL